MGGGEKSQKIGWAGGGDGKHRSIGGRRVCTVCCGCSENRVVMIIENSYDSRTEFYRCCSTRISSPCLHVVAGWEPSIIITHTARSAVHAARGRVFPAHRVQPEVASELIHVFAASELLYL